MCGPSWATLLRKNRALLKNARNRYYLRLWECRKRQLYGRAVEAVQELTHYLFMPRKTPPITRRNRLTRSCPLNNFLGFFRLWIRYGFTNDKSSLLRLPLPYHSQAEKDYLISITSFSLALLISSIFLISSSVSFWISSSDRFSSSSAIFLSFIAFLIASFPSRRMLRTAVR